MRANEPSRPRGRSAAVQRMRPASTSSDGEVDDGADSAAGAPLAAVAGVFGATASGEAVGSAGAGVALAALAAADADFASSAFAEPVTVDDFAAAVLALALDV